MSETISTIPRSEGSAQGNEGWDTLQEVVVSPEEVKRINEKAESILRRAGKAGMEKADFFNNLDSEGLTEEQIFSALAAEAAPIFEASDRVYWLGPSN